MIDLIQRLEKQEKLKLKLANKLLIQIQVLTLIQVKNNASTAQQLIRIGNPADTGYLGPYGKRVDFSDPQKNQQSVNEARQRELARLRGPQQLIQIGNPANTGFLGANRKRVDFTIPQQSARIGNPADSIPVDSTAFNIPDSVAFNVPDSAAFSVPDSIPAHIPDSVALNTIPVDSAAFNISDSTASWTTRPITPYVDKYGFPLTRPIVDRSGYIRQGPARESITNRYRQGGQIPSYQQGGGILDRIKQKLSERFTDPNRTSSK